MITALVPYSTVPEAEQKLGLIDGVRYLPYPDADVLPAGAETADVLVQPYLSGLVSFGHMDDLPNVRLVQLQTAGYEGVPELIPDHVTLCNATGVHDASTAELAIALALESGRRLDLFARWQPEHRWETVFGTALADRHVLILGYGSIGAAIERRLAGFEVASITRVARRARDEPEVKPVTDLPSVLPHVDVVFVIVPLTPDTDGLVGAEELALLPDGALLVNVARGRIVDTDALVAELQSGRLRAALDVTEPEPLSAGHPLWDCENAIIVPHIGGASTAFAPRRDRLIAEQLRRLSSGEPLANVVAGPAR